MPRPKAATARPRRDEWGLHRRELTRLFIVEKKSVADIVKYMKNQYGFDKEPKDYEYRYKKWNLRRNLHEKELRYIAAQFSRRGQAGKESEIVVSGVRWRESLIFGRLDRHKRPWVPTDQVDIHSIPEFLARVQTPSPLMSSIAECPEELPWLIFNQTLRQALGIPMQSTMAGSMFDCQTLEALSFKLMRSNNLSFRTSLMSIADIDNLPPARQMRALLEVLAPEVHQGDHETTAAILHTGSQESMAIELVRLLIYFESNNMGGEILRITGSNLNDLVPADTMEFLRGVGFLTHANINWLGRSASLTSHAFLERLLFYSICDENSLDVLEWLVPGHFDVNHSVRIPFKNNILYPKGYDAIQASSPECGCLLQASALAGNIHAVQHLLGLGADLSNSSQQGYSPLVCAASLKHHDRAAVIADRLLRKPTRSSSEFHEEDLEGSLQLAIAAGNAALITRLLLERKRLGNGTIRSQHLTIAVLHAHADCDTIRLLADHAERCSDGSMMLPKDILFSVFSDSHKRDDLDFLLDMLEYLLGLGADPAVLMCREVCGRGFLLDHVFKFFLHRTRSLIGNQHALRLVKTLRKHGCPLERPLPKCGVDYEESALQLAIASGHAELVEYLLDWGLEINHWQESMEFDIPECEGCDASAKHTTQVVRGRSPLLTAIQNTEIEIAKMLLRRQPNLKLRGGEQELAMKVCDDTELVTMLLQAGSANANGWRDFLEAAIRRSNPKSIKLLLSMNHDGHGAIDSTTMLRAASITGDRDKIYQQLAVCDYDSKALFQAVIRTHKSEAYHPIVERLLKARPKSPNDSFEILAVFDAALYQDMHLLDLLTRNFQQGPWVISFRDIRGERDTPLDSTPGFVARYQTHILTLAAGLERGNKDATLVNELLKFNVSAEGMHLNTTLELPAETWKQLIAAGADPNAGRALLDAVRGNLLEHVQVLCEAKATLDTIIWTGRSHRTATQVAFEAGSPEMLQMLLRYGADVGDPAGAIRGATCLQLAAGAGNIGLVRFLLDKGARVNAKRSFMEGRTAIEIAAEHGRLDVLRLLLLQEQDLFKTSSERFQFIRAVKLAEINCHGPITKMLKEHINWNSDDQRLLDEIQCPADFFLRLDEMTQKPMDSERLHDNFWREKYHESKYSGIEDIYDIDGIENWIGERPESGTDCSSVEGEDDLASEDLWPTGQYRNVSHERVVRASGHRSREELHSDMDQPGELLQASDPHDACADPTDLQGHLMGEHAATSRPEWGLNTGSREGTRVLAPSAVRHDDNIPRWLDTADHWPDSTMQGVFYDQAPQRPTWESLTHRPAAPDVCRQSGMVLGEVLGEVPQICGIVDDPDSVDHDNSENVGEASHTHVQHFNWGFWDEESFGFQSGQLV